MRSRIKMRLKVWQVKCCFRKRWLPSGLLTTRNLSAILRLINKCASSSCLKTPSIVWRAHFNLQTWRSFWSQKTSASAGPLSMLSWKWVMSVIRISYLPDPTKTQGIQEQVALKQSFVENIPFRMEMAVSWALQQIWKIEKCIKIKLEIKVFLM